MNETIKKEEMVNNSYQPHNRKSKMEILKSKHPKGKTMDEIQWLYFYFKNKEFLQLEGVEKTIKVIVDYHQSQKMKYSDSTTEYKSGNQIISMGETLLKTIKNKENEYRN